MVIFNQKTGIWGRQVTVYLAGLASDGLFRKHSCRDDGLLRKDPGRGKITQVNTLAWQLWSFRPEAGRQVIPQNAGHLCEVLIWIL